MRIMGWFFHEIVVVIPVGTPVKPDIGRPVICRFITCVCALRLTGATVMVHRPIPRTRIGDLIYMENFASRSIDELEDHVLVALENEESDAENLLEILEHVASGEDAERAAEWAELLQDALSVRADSVNGLALLKMRLAWPDTTKAVGSKLKDNLKKVFLKDRNGIVFVENIGLDDKLSVETCVARLNTLMSLAEGTLVYDGTWGVGTIKELDSFYKRVHVDFARKRNHELSYNYAAETLRVLDSDDLLALAHQDPARMQELIKKEADQVVIRTLQTFGNMNVIQLQERLAEIGVDEKGWKSFWDRARKKLKDNPSVEIPSKRNEAVTYTQRDKRYDEQWFKSLTATRDIKGILSLIETFMDAPDGGKPEEQGVAAIAERLAFVVKGSGSPQDVTAIHAAMLALRCGVSTDFVDADGLLTGLRDDEEAAEYFENLPARLLKDMTVRLVELDGDAARARMLEVLSDVSSTVVSDFMDHLLADEIWQEKCRAFYRDAVAKKAASVACTYWLVRRLHLIKEWNLGRPSELAPLILNVVEKRYGGERLRNRHQVVEEFEKPEFLEMVLGDLELQAQKDILNRIQRSDAWNSQDGSMLTARILNLFPAINESILSDKTEASTVIGGVTAWSRYRERQAQLKNLTEIEIPANSEAIGIARSYGDLRENAEYDDAKEAQGLLMQRKAELERDLQKIKGTDFSDLPTDKAGIGTTVHYTDESGAALSVTILGEWDRDEALNLISCRSELAQRLMGKSTGDTVDLVTATGEERCTIQRIEGLSDELRAWVK